MKIISCITSMLFLFNTLLVAQERFRRNPPLPEPLQRLNLPRIESTSLTNGLPISVIRRENLSIITARLLIFTGESSSPEETPGLATFTANMVNKGSQNLSFAEIEEGIESIGGNFSTETFPDYTMISFSFLDDYLDQALELLKEMLLFPAFPQREIDNMKRVMFYNMATKMGNPEFIGKRVLHKILFNNHAYQKVLFDNDVIKNFNRRSLSTFFYKFYRPKNAHLILVGNISLSNATIKVSRYLNTWRGGARNTIGFPPPDENDRVRICFVTVPQAKSTVIFMGNQIPSKDTPYHFPLLVLNQVLGGSHLSRLFMNLREAKGYAYWAYSNMDFFKTCGIFYIIARVRPEAIYDSIQEGLREIMAIYSQRISNREIETAKTSLIGKFPISLEKPEDLTSRISEIHAFNLEREHWDHYYESVMVIDAQTVYEAVQKTALRTPVIVIAGESSVLDHMLEFTEVEIYDMSGNYQYSMKKENTNEAH